MSERGNGEGSGGGQAVERYGSVPGHGGPLHVLALGALGVVFGDIGTSPLYAFKTCLTAIGPLTSRPLAVLGVLSLIFWAITLVVTVKYVGLVLRADNRGEGGVLALTALFCLGLAIVLLVLLVAVIFWDEHRLLAVGLLAALFALCGLGSLLALRSAVRKRPRFLSATLAELRKDEQELGRQ